MHPVTWVFMLQIKKYLLALTRGPYENNQGRLLMCSVHNFHCKVQQSLSTDVVSKKCAYIKKTGSLLAYQEEFPFRQWQKYFFCLFFFFLGLSNYEWVNGEEIDIVTIFENWLMKVIISCSNSLHIHFFFS